MSVRQKESSLVGDNVEIEVLDEKDMEGSIRKILPRRTELIRPAVANIDQALVVFAVTEPSPHLKLLDRFLVMMESRDIPAVLCFNKTDIGSSPEIEELKEIYAACGYPVIFTSARQEEMAEKENIQDCIECGSCSYTCPAYRPLLDNIRVGKAKVMGIIRARKK